MSYLHRCLKCGKTVEYEHAIDLKDQFYFKSGYYRNVCKDCEKEEHKEKYKQGQYNYRKKKDSDDPRMYAFGYIGE